MKTSLLTSNASAKLANPRRVLDDAGSNTGHALATAVYNELTRRGAEVANVKTTEGYEVDFLARHTDGRQELIQVCADVSDAATRESETRALDAAHAEHPKAERIVVVLDTVSARALTHPKTRVVAAHQWLLLRGVRAMVAGTV